MDRTRTAALSILCNEAESFMDTVKALQELKDAVHPHAESLDENAVWRSAVAKQIPKLPVEKRETYFATMSQAFPIVLGFTTGASRAYTDIEPQDDDESGWQEKDPIE